MDTATAQGELVFHIFGALAQFERSLIQERVQAGLAAAPVAVAEAAARLTIGAEKLGAVAQPWTAARPRPRCAALSGSSAAR